MFAVPSTAASEHPPRILAIETSGSVCAVALVRAHISSVSTRSTSLASTIECSRSSPNACSPTSAALHSTLLLSLLDLAHLPVCALALLLQKVSVSPVGCHCSRYRHSRRAAAAVPIARQIHDCDIAAIAAAHDELFFVQHYSADGQSLTAVEVAPATAIERRISQTTILCGPGAVAFRQGIHIPGLERLAARFVARRAAELYAAGVRHDPATVTPLYVEEFAPRQPVKEKAYLRSSKADEQSH